MHHAVRLPRRLLATVALATAMTLSGAAHADDETQESLQELIGEATQVVTDFTNAPKMEPLRELMKSAKGVFISPKITTLGFVIAGSAGRGVVLLRNGEQWSQPAFYRYKEGSVGLQAGGSQAAVMLLLMTDKGVNAVLEEKVNLGAGIGVAAGPIGGGTSQSIKDEADVISYTMSEGLFAGVALSGGHIDYRKGWNSEYYGGRVPGPRAILVEGTVSSEGTAPLVEAVTKLGM